jgi:hypothetical protein
MNATGPNIYREDKPKKDTGRKFYGEDTTMKVTGRGLSS